MGAAKIVGQSATGGAMALTFEPARTQYDADRDIVRFMGMDGVLIGEDSRPQLLMGVP